MKTIKLNLKHSKILEEHIGVRMNSRFYTPCKRKDADTQIILIGKPDGKKIKQKSFYFKSRE